MAEIIKRDESVLTDSEKGILNRTLEKMEQFFPEHKVYAFDSLCAQQRENASKLSKTLGYESLDEFLQAYGYEPIKGPAVYEVRKDVGIKPGEEPDLIKVRFDNAINSLNEYYPNHVIEGAIQKEHKNLAQTLSGFWQWLGYESMEAMLAAYGFTYITQVGRAKSVDPEAIINELKKRYPEGTTMTAAEIKAANPDLKIKSVMNDSKKLFGMAFAKYLVEQGIIVGEKAKSKEEKEAEKQAERESNFAESLAECEKIIQQHYIGWKMLPNKVDVVFEEIGDSTLRRKFNKATEVLNLDQEEHLRSLGVLTDDSTDNELRKLMRFVNLEGIF